MRAGTRKDNQRGVALILVLLFVVLLTAIVVEFIYEMQVEASFATNNGGDLEAYLAARSGVSKALALLADDLQGSGLTGDRVNSPDKNQGTTPNSRSNRSSLPGRSGGDKGSLTGESMNDEYTLQDVPWVDSFMDSAPWYAGVPYEPLNNAMMRASISDECGKINLNALLDYQQQPPAERQWLVNALREFFILRLDGADPAAADVLVDGILDWMDFGDGDDPREQGAENDYYMGLENPFPCKNGPFNAIEELLLLKGMTPEIYFGSPELEQLPLSEYLTVHGDFQGRVNPNTAPEEVLAALLTGLSGQGVDPGVATEIYERVQEQPFQDVSELSQYVGGMGGMNANEGEGAARNAPNAQNNLNNRNQGGGRNGNSSGRTGGFALKSGAGAAKQRFSTRPDRQSPNTNRRPDPETDPEAPGEGENENPVPSDRTQTSGAGQVFTVSSNIFRIYGDGMAGDVMVRIEAYVWRRPSEENMDLQNGQGLPQDSLQSGRTVRGAGRTGLDETGGLNEGENGMMASDNEAFRILDWKVIR